MQRLISWQFTSAVTVSLKFGNGEGGTVESKWVKERYDKYQKRQSEKKLEDLGKHNAISGYAAMFERLKGQVIEDLQAYNGLFSLHAVDRECRADFQKSDSGFSVSVKNNILSVSKAPEGTIINFGWHTQREGVFSPGESGCLEVISENGNLKYRHNKKVIDECAASLLLLDPILCGGQEESSSESSQT